MYSSHLLPLFGLANIVFAGQCSNPGSRCAPGGNFDLKGWDLQLPIGTQGSPDTIPNSKLEGCDGYQEKPYFFTAADGAMVMYVPGGTATTHCVTTAHTEHCRTELRELDPKTGNITSWNPNGGPNRLTATVSAIVVDNSTHGTIIGQIHVDGSVSQYPVAKLYYASSGDLYFGVVDSLKTGNTVYTKVGHVPLKTKFRYEIRYEKNVLSVGIDGGDQQVFANTLGAPLSYFKAGNYNQGETPSAIQFYSVQVLH